MANLPTGNSITANVLAGLENASWFQRTFDPSKVQMEYNAQQAQIDRDFQQLEAQTARDFNARESALAREFSAQEAEKNRQYQTEMSNTAYTRAVQDLKNAGLNPYLAYSQGGASSPSGATAQMTSASASAPTGARASAGQSGLANGLLSLASTALKLALTKKPQTNITKNYYS